MDRRQFLTGTAAGAAGALAGCPERGGSASASRPPRLSVEGRWLTDPDGRRVVLRGVNAVDPSWGVENEAQRGKGYWDTLRLATDAEAGWHARVLRVPITPGSVQTAGLDTILGDYLDRIVDLAAEQGAYVVVDYHAIGRYDTSDIDTRLRKFWDRVAPRYADEPHVIYELFNEPTEPAGNGLQSWRTWRRHAEPWIDLVRDHAPDTPIVVGSPRWTSMTKFAAVEPFEDENLLYSAHVYPSWAPDSWEETFGAPALDVPVFVTEWGYVGPSTDRAESHLIATTSEWGEPFREWIESHPNVSWCVTTFDSYRLPNLFDGDWNLLGGEDYAGELARGWLADRREDHWPPGEGETGTVSDGGESPPDPPSDLRVESIGETEVTLAWAAASDPDGSEIAQYRVAIGDREPVVVRGPKRSIEISGLSPAEEYETTVTAVDDGGLESEPAAVAFRTTAEVTPDATIPRAPVEPDVDAEEEDVWSMSEEYAIDTLQWGNRKSTDGGDWRAIWDDQAMYVLVEVIDETEQLNDSVELYLDLDHSGGQSYDGENDLQLIVIRGTNRVLTGTYSVDSPDGTRVATTETDDGWRIEIAIPWDGFDVSPVTGHRIGFDVSVADDIVEGNGYDAKFAWHDETGEAWEAPERFGTVELTE
ncbi:cellulase family glycosylhydrolase [Halomicrobium salinisoli]|uniref:cellulase family glycosylhydrolase n=1 Tax=Halomicrobium salinisoli TaxID=2878391 RepID=UPI001CEFC267|nr:cellulase family glycosylhydrolase [Halomicrobium salinisoli]